MNIDRDDEYATRYEAAPTIEEQIELIREMVSDEIRYGITGTGNQAILASLEKLAALESQPVPVEPEYLIRLRNALKWFKSDGAFAGDKDIVDYIDSLQSALQRLAEEIKSERECRNAAARAYEKAESINRRMVEQYRDLVVAAKKAQEAMNVWVNTYAPEFCDKEHVENSRKIISESGGTLAYIADINEQIHEALAKLEEA